MGIQHAIPISYLSGLSFLLAESPPAGRSLCSLVGALAETPTSMQQRFYSRATSPSSMARKGALWWRPDSTVLLNFPHAFDGALAVLSVCQDAQCTAAVGQIRSPIACLRIPGRAVPRVPGQAPLWRERLASKVDAPPSSKRPPPSAWAGVAALRSRSRSARRACTSNCCGLRSNPFQFDGSLLEFILANQGLAGTGVAPRSSFSMRTPAAQEPS